MPSPVFEPLLSIEHADQSGIEHRGGGGGGGGQGVWPRRQEYITPQSVQLHYGCCPDRISSWRHFDDAMRTVHGFSFQ